MRILYVHNRYFWRGGEDVCVDNELSALSELGHEIYFYEKSNRELVESGKLSVVGRLIRSSFNKKVFSEISDICRKFKPDVAKVQNTWFAASPSVYSAIDAQSVPIIQDLQNFRQLCLNAQLIRNGKECNLCVGKLPWRGVVFSCYRSSRLQSMIMYRMINQAVKLGSWRAKVKLSVAYSEFVRSKYIEAGYPAEKVIVQPPIVKDYSEIQNEKAESCDCLYIGRISGEKGIEVLLKSWRKVHGDFSLGMIGDGPMMEQVRQVAVELNNIKLFGHLDHQTAMKILSGSKLLVVPSLTYETFGLVAVEAMSLSVPIILSNTGALRELVVEGSNGCLVPPGDSDALACRITDILSDSSVRSRMAANARKVYEKKFSEKTGMVRLNNLYEKIVAETLS